MEFRPLNNMLIGGIRKRYRLGFMIWAIAAELNLTEWQVAKQLMKDGVPYFAVAVSRNRKKR